MPRSARTAPGGVVFHCLNRGNNRAKVFAKDGDYAAFGAGQVFTKTAYNGVNWVTATYTGYNTSGVSYAQAQITTGDIIIEQQGTTYDFDGSAVSTSSLQRLNDASASTTGALTSGNARIMYTAAWFDGIGRAIATASYGAASSFTRPATPPASGSTVLVTGTAYDTAGRAYQTTDPKSIVAQTNYDNANRTIQTIEDFGGLARTTNFTWTLDNNKATMTAVNAVTGDQTTAWLYGTTLTTSGVARADLLSQTVYPDALGWSSQWGNLAVDDWAALPLDPTGDVTSLTYSRLGEKQTFTDQRGVVRTFNRDKLGRQTNDCVTTCPAGVDSMALQIARTYEIRGMVSGVTSYPNASTTSPGTAVNDCQLNYNDFAQLIQEYQSHAGPVVPGTTPSVQYAYDNGSANEIRLNTLIYPNLRNIAYSFGTSGGMNDLLNRVDTIQDTTSGTTNLASYTYLGLGTVVRITYPQPSVWLDLWGGSSGVFAGLDLFNRVIDQRWQNNTGGTPVDIDRYRYGYDFNSNRQYKANVVGTANVAAGLDEYYTNDNLNRLTDMQRGVLNGTNTGITGTIAREMIYGLDPTGNWSTYVTATAGTTDLNQGRASNTINEITSITESGGTPLWVTPAYDAAGNMTTMPQPGTPTSPFDAAYDAWNRMTGVDAAGSPVGQYQYDGRNRRIVAVTTQTRHFYFTDNWQDIEQRVGTLTTMDQQHVWGIRYVDELVCRDDATPERLYACQDAIFSLTALIDTTGTPHERLVFDPYGDAAVLDGSWAATSDAFAWGRRFTGQQFDTETQLYLYRARFYHPLLGAFPSRDAAGYPSGPSLYEYVMSCPMSDTDPGGHAPGGGGAALRRLSAPPPPPAPPRPRTKARRPWKPPPLGAQVIDSKLETGTVVISRYDKYSRDTLVWQALGLTIYVAWIPPTTGDWAKTCWCKPCTSVGWIQDIAKEDLIWGEPDETIPHEDWGVADVDEYGASWGCAKRGGAGDATFADQPAERIVFWARLRNYRFNARARAVCLAGPQKGTVYAEVRYGFSIEDGLLTLFDVYISSESAHPIGSVANDAGSSI
jgi:RHS repeat-associated protein